MAKDKKSFVAYCDWIDSFEELEDEEAGRLVKHLFRYVNDKSPEAPDKLTKMCFIPIKQALKRDLEKYESIRERNKENGKKGGRPKKPTGLSGNLEKPKKADNDSGNDNDIKKNKVDFDFEIYLKKLNELFGKNHKVVTKKLKEKVNARLKQGFTKENFWIAMQNVKKNQYHIDNNFEYVNPLFFAQEEKLTKYGDRLRKGGSNTYQLID